LKSFLPKETFPDYEISTKEFIYVEKLLPKNRIPDPIEKTKITYEKIFLSKN
jgi:hypothetical protein